MIALYLLAAHMVGDFVLQTRWQAAGKFADRALRMRHVAFYGLPFYAVLAADWPGLGRASGFMLGLYALHFLTDSRRFRSTLGDVLGWSLNPHHRWWKQLRPLDQAAMPEFGPLPPNPWPPMPILIDQTLHVCQVALLAGIFLS